MSLQSLDKLIRVRNVASKGILLSSQGLVKRLRAAINRSALYGMAYPELPGPKNVPDGEVGVPGLYRNKAKKFAKQPASLPGQQKFRLD